MSIKLDGDDIPLYNHASLGGFLNLSGLSHGGLFDENVALAELIYYRKDRGALTALGRGVYAGFSGEAGESLGRFARLQNRQCRLRRKRVYRGRYSGGRVAPRLGLRGRR
jgi:hypothetical protein